MLFRAALLLGAAVLPLSAVAQASPQTAAPAAAPVKPIAFTERTLANGLRVYAIHDPSTANVSVNVWYDVGRSEEHTSELQSLMRISYAVFCLNKNTNHTLNKD